MHLFNYGAVLLLLLLPNLCIQAKQNGADHLSSHGDANKDFHENSKAHFKSFFEEMRTFDSIFGEGGFQKSLYNTSAAFTVPFFSYYLPDRTEPGGVTDLLNQAIYGLFGVLGITLIFSIPVLLTGVMHNQRSSSRSIDGDSEYDNNWITSPIMKIKNVKDIFDEEFRDQIGLDFKKCMQKMICDAHRSPKNKKYGLLAIPFQILYPVPAKEDYRRSSQESNYKTSAFEGKYGNEECGKMFTCFFDTLDLASFLIDWYRLRNDPEYVPKETDFY